VTTSLCFDFPMPCRTAFSTRGCQNESRDRTAGAIRINLKFKSKAVSKTSLLNADVVLDELNFAGERDFVRVHSSKEMRRQFTQAQEDILSSVGDLRGSGSQQPEAYEQEMRMKLGPQIFDLRFGQARFQLGRANLARPGLIVRAVKLRRAHNQPVSRKDRLPYADLSSVAGLQRAATPRQRATHLIHASIERWAAVRRKPIARWKWKCARPCAGKNWRRHVSQMASGASRPHM